MTHGARAALVLIAVLAVAACEGGKKPEDLGEPRQRTATQGRVGDLFSGGILGGRPAEQGGAIAVNRHLWLASLDTLSFLPLASTDPFSGVIATDWSANANAPDERFKVTVYVSDPALAATSLRVAVFREVRDAGGAWVTADVSETTPRRLEDAILTRARQIRVTELETSRQRG